MRPPRVRISSLIGFVVACALAFAAMKHASQDVEQVAFTATVVALILAILRAVHRPGAPRAYWSAFALAGGAYLALTLIPATAQRLATNRALDTTLQWISHSIGGMTVTDGGHTITLLNDFSPFRSTATPIADTTPPRNGTWFRQVTDSTIQTGNVANFTNFTGQTNPPIDWGWFRRTGHDLLAWVFGAIAGTIARAWWLGPRHRHGWDRLRAS